MQAKKTAYDYPKIYEFEFFVSVDEVEEDLSKVTDISKIPKDSSKFVDTAFEFCLMKAILLNVLCSSIRIL